MSENEVTTAFELLLEEIKIAKSKIIKQLKDLADSENFDMIKTLSKKAKKMNDFQKKVQTLKKEWNKLSASDTNYSIATKKRNTNKKLKRGLKTNQESFRIPILQTLVEMGGAARMSVVMEKLEEKMKNKLTEYDWLPLPSNPKSIRWKNTAQWTRNKLKEEGLISANSEYGIWKITDKGRKWLAEILSNKK